MQRVTRPRGGINEWLHWLPVSVHKKLEYVIRQIFGYSRLLSAARGEKPVCHPLENGGNVGLSSVLEADVRQIVTMARETYEKYAFLFFYFLLLKLFICAVKKCVKVDLWLKPILDLLELRNLE